MTLPQSASLVLGGFVAGVVNAIAGGGTLISFPILLALGRDPLIANATNTVALWPGSLAGSFGFRGHLTGRRVFGYVITPFLGSAAGAVLLLLTPSRTFAWLVPYLIVCATVLFAVADRITRVRADERSGRLSGAAWTVLFLGGLYGGYFGAGLGIITLSALGILGIDDLHERNAIKNRIAAAVGGIASLLFVTRGLVLWHDALLMGTGAVLGGWVGAHLAQGLGRVFVRRAVIAIGLGLTVWYFAHPA